MYDRNMKFFLASFIAKKYVICSFYVDLLSMEACQYTEETLEAAIRKFEGFDKTLVFKPSRDMAATKSTKDLYFEEMERRARWKTIMGTLEAHVNGFGYKTSSAHPHIDVMYENIKCPFFRAGDHEITPLLHFHLHNQIMLGTEETNNIHFQLESTPVVQTDDRNKDLQDFVDKVTDLWESEPIVINYFEPPEYEFHVVFKDFSRDVLQINSIPLELLANIKHRLTCSNVKYYQNKQKLNWNDEVKKFRDSPQKFIINGGWESLNLETGDACDCYYWEEDGESVMLVTVTTGKKLVIAEINSAYTRSETRVIIRESPSQALCWSLVGNPVPRD
ncbi:hypothetical protein C5167_023607 [Papaver somniferum]|uniref:FACT complex subunit n=1 Tax=Papaver somniferum TaxID=3469 RepID=A0A4Y7JP77_PAPSO|nr:hypothetical protein C5167_023607 [Papaver somniferum]